MANILEQVQQVVADKLNENASLSACTFLVENRKDIDYQIKNALGRQGIVGLVMTPKAVYAGKYEDASLVWQLDSLEVDIVENVTVNRGNKNGFITGQDAAMKVFDILCPLDGAQEGQFNPVSYEEGEDGGLLVNKCVLKCLVYDDGAPQPPGPAPLHMQFVKLLDEAPPLSVQWHDGWMWPNEQGYALWQNGTEHSLIVKDWFDQQISSYAQVSAVNELSGIVSQISSDMHGDYIQDEDGNSISANRQVTYQGTLPTPYWHISLDGGALEFDMTGPKTDSAYVKLPHEEGDTGFYLQFADSQWTLTQVTWTWDEAEQEWTQFTDVTFTESGSADDTELSFGDGYVSVTWMTTGTLTGTLATSADLSAYATKQYVDGLMGDLSSIIHSM